MTVNKKYFFGAKGLLLVALLAGCAAGVKQARQDAEGYVSIFNGRNLDGWIGDSTYWKVENNCLVGTVTPATLLKRNTFIVWQGSMPPDFELKVLYKVSDAGNSGINYRSEPVEGMSYTLKGYQADLDGANNYTGSNYEERKRTTLASGGQRVMLPPSDSAPDSLKAYSRDNRWMPTIELASLGDRDSLKMFIKKDGWNEYHIIARGNHLQHFLNDVLMSDVTDNDTANRRLSGLLGVQVHVGPPMRVAYRNFRLKKL